MGGADLRKDYHVIFLTYQHNLKKAAFYSIFP